VCMNAIQVGRAGPQLAVESLGNSSFLIDAKGELLCWGRGGPFLGIGGNNNQLTPQRVSFPPGVRAWKSAAAGPTVTLAIGDDGQLYGWGFLNVTSNQIPYYPTLIPSPDGSGWTAVAAGRDAWLGLTGNGGLYGWQNGAAGMYHHPSPPTGSHWTKVAIGLDEIMTLSDSGRLYSKKFFVSYLLTEVPLPAGTTAWTDVASGQYLDLAIANDGNLYAWGDNDYGQLGIGVTHTERPFGTNTPQRVSMPAGVTGWKAIAAGNAHSLALSSNGLVYGWGGNWYGQIGGAGTSVLPNPTLIAGVSNATGVTVGQDYSLIVANCGVFGSGRNGGGQLGIGVVSAQETNLVPATFVTDICSTNVASLPVVSLIASDAYASESSWWTNYDDTYTNTGSFLISRLVPETAELTVYYTVGGTAISGAEYGALSGVATIPAGSGYVEVMITPTGQPLPGGDKTIVVTISPDAAYTLGDSTNAVITLAQYESEPQPPLPPMSGLTMKMAVTGGPSSQVFTIQASTNLAQWTTIATVTNSNGVLSFIETNATRFERRFFRAMPVVNP
jgi:alpha-tubulin suppressor-like RCC1 family protein